MKKATIYLSLIGILCATLLWACNNEHAADNSQTELLRNIVQDKDYLAYENTGYNKWEEIDDSYELCVSGCTSKYGSSVSAPGWR